MFRRLISNFFVVKLLSNNICRPQPEPFSPLSAFCCTSSSAALPSRQARYSLAAFYQNMNWSQFLKVLKSRNYWQAGLQPFCLDMLLFRTMQYLMSWTVLYVSFLPWPRSVGSANTIRHPFGLLMLYCNVGISSGDTRRKQATTIDFGTPIFLKILNLLISD